MTLGFARGDAAPLVLHGDESFSRSDIAERAEALAEILRTNYVQRALVCTDHPMHILRAIEACSQVGAALYIAHTNIHAELMDEIRAEFAIQMTIGDEDRLHGNDPAASSAAAGIFMMTSGTTGRPKIAAHTLDSLLSRVRASTHSAMHPAGKWLLTYQPTGFAGIQVILTAAHTRGVIVSVPQRTPAAFYQAARTANVTQISATPTFWRALLMVAVPSELPLRQITLGGEAVDQVTLDRLRKAFPNARITHTYASTEAGVVFAVHDGIEGFPVAWLERPPHGIQLRIADGLLQIKSPHTMRGYASQASQPILNDGWLSTADRCEVRGDRVRILGREDATINVGGSKVYPLAIETFLLSLPQVSEARVFAVPNPISGFLVAAEVVLAPGQISEEARPAILAACRERLASYQVPRVLKIVESITVGASGKKGAAA